MRLLAVGSIALDDLEGPFGTVAGELGGSALYFSLAASLFRPVEIVAPAGRESLEAIRRAIGDRPVDVTGVAFMDEPTYRWRARQELGTNVDLGSSESIYDHWDAQPPPGFDGWAFVGSMRPDRQLEAARALRDSASLLAGDSMRSYLTSHREQAEQVLGACGWFFSNREELVALGGDAEQPDGFRSRWSLDGLVVKAGAQGCSAWTDAGHLHLPASAARAVVDVTGAGDALAGGMLAHWLESGGGQSALREALAHGIACASIAISTVGLKGIATATRADLEPIVAGLLER